MACPITQGDHNKPNVNNANNDDDVTAKVHWAAPVEHTDSNLEPEMEQGQDIWPWTSYPAHVMLVSNHTFLSK